MVELREAQDELRLGLGLQTYERLVAKDKHVYDSA